METPICLRCKKIGYELKKESVSIDAIKVIFEEAPIAKIVNKAYNSIPHLSGSRLGEKDHHIDPKQEAFLTTAFPPIKCILYVEEKMDGSNAAVIRKNGELIAIGRSGYACKNSDQEQYRKFAQWVDDNKEKFESLLPNEDDKVCGEWLALAHGTLYKEMPSPFRPFDLFYGKDAQNGERRREEFKRVGLNQVPILSIRTSPIPIEEALKLAIEHREETEGVVYRLERWDKKKDTYVPWIIAKVVRQEKEDGRYLDADNPQWLWY